MWRCRVSVVLWIGRDGRAKTLSPWTGGVPRRGEGVVKP